LPFSAITSITNANGTAQYVAGSSRNQGNRNLNVDAVNAYRATSNLAAITSASIRSNNYNSLDVHLSKAFFRRENRYLEVIGQCFNVLGHQNLLASAYINNAASASFGNITAASNLQQAELAARFVF
jgi:hypothetical protein